MGSKCIGDGNKSLKLGRVEREEERKLWLLMEYKRRELDCLYIFSKTLRSKISNSQRPSTSLPRPLSNSSDVLVVRSAAITSYLGP